MDQGSTLLTIENSQKTVLVACDGQPLLRYQAITTASKPHFDLVAIPSTADARAGENIVLAAPHDRVWHLGLFFSPGCLDGLSFHESELLASRGERHGVCRGQGPVQTRVCDDGGVAFSHGIRWQTSDGENWLNEKREIVVHPPRGNAYRIDWKMTWTPVGGDRVCNAASGESGGTGLSFRPPRSMDDAAGQILSSRGNKTLEGVHGAAARWCDYTGKLDGKLDWRNPNRAGITIMADRYIAGHPSAWFSTTKPFAFLSTRPACAEDWTMKQDQPLTVEYGILVHSGEPDPARIESEYWAFARHIPCPCCGHYGITDTFDICLYCSWQHDPVQSDDPDYTPGANEMSLREAQRNFLRFGAKNERSVRDSRKPTADDYRDPAWRPLGEA